MSISVAANVREQFQQLKNDWKAQSRYLLNTAQMAMLWPYQRIIGLGNLAVPLILAELARETDHWFWALEAITGENPAPPGSGGSLITSAEAWLHWGRQKGFLAEERDPSAHSVPEY